MSEERNIYKEMMRIVYERWLAIQGTPAVLAWAVSPDIIGVFDWYAHSVGDVESMSEFACRVEQTFKEAWDQERLSYCSIHGSLWCLTCFSMAAFDG